jgi:hypothetical protein
MTRDDREIYFHVGLGKVASTYLQQEVFPNLKGITYISPRQYRRSKEIIANHSGSRFLVSREFDVQLEEELKWFTSKFSNVRVIVFFRRQDSWLLSQYKRYVKNGWYKGFGAFFDLEADAHWGPDEVFFERKLDLIEQYTGKKPLVLFHDDLLSDPGIVIDQVAAFTHTEYVPGSIAYRKVHTSYSEKQLKFLLFFTRSIFRHFPDDHTHNKVKHWLFFRPWWMVYHMFLYVGALLPDSWFSSTSLVDHDRLEEIRSYFSEDWDYVQEYNRSEEELIYSQSSE